MNCVELDQQPMEKKMFEIGNRVIVTKAYKKFLDELAKNHAVSAGVRENRVGQKATVTSKMVGGFFVVFDDGRQCGGIPTYALQSA